VQIPQVHVPLAVVVGWALVRSLVGVLEFEFEGEFELVDMADAEVSRATLDGGKADGPLPVGLS